MTTSSRPEIELPSAHKYYVDGILYPSVTTIINAVVPKNLAWWGMQVGCEGSAHVFNEDHKEGIIGFYTGEELVERIKQNKQTVFNIRDDAGFSGLQIHQAMHNWAETKKVPNLMDFREEARPRVSALARFLIENKPEVLASEVRTVCFDCEYAGTFDLRVKMGSKTGILDVKTGKRVYPDSQFPQLEAYEHAEVELGAEPSDFRAILHLGADGQYSVEESTDTFEDFEVLLRHWQSMQRRKQRDKDASG